MTKLAVDADGAAGLLDEAVDHGQAQARALVALLGGKERLKGALQGFLSTCPALYPLPHTNVMACFQVACLHHRMAFIKFLQF